MDGISQMNMNDVRVGCVNGEVFVPSVIVRNRPRKTNLRFSTKFPLSGV